MTWQEIKKAYAEQWILLEILDLKETEYSDFEVDFQSYKEVKRTQVLCSQFKVIESLGKEIIQSKLNELEAWRVKLPKNEKDKYCIIHTSWDGIFNKENNDCMGK